MVISRLKKAIKILINYEQKNVSKNDVIQSERVKSWFLDNGDQTFRLNYNLTSDSIVFDVGGYKGEFASDILCKYNSNIYIFEPVKDFYDIIKSKFSNNNKVLAFNFGLSGKDEILQIGLINNASSVYLTEGFTEKIQLKSIVNFLSSKKISKIDLIKINIEGGEYELLESLIEHKFITLFENIQVQFHDFLFENAMERMNKIQSQLSKTHELTYQYEFVWENWKLK